MPQLADRNINIRITDDEYNYVTYKAYQKGLTLTEYIKSKVLEDDFQGQTSRPKARPSDRDENGRLREVPKIC